MSSSEGGPSRKSSSDERQVVAKYWLNDLKHLQVSKTRVELKDRHFLETICKAEDSESPGLEESIADEKISFIDDFPPLDDDYLRECLGEYPDFLYHIAKDKYGGVYFRVIRSLLLDKGTLY